MRLNLSGFGLKVGSVGDVQQITRCAPKGNPHESERNKMGKSQSKAAKFDASGYIAQYDTLVFFQMRKLYGRRCLQDIDKLIKYHDFPVEGTFSVTWLKIIKEDVEAGNQVKVGCWKRKHVCVNCGQTVNCWLQEAEKRERKTLQKQLVQPEEKEVQKEEKIEKPQEEDELGGKNNIDEIVRKHLSELHPTNPFFSVFPPSYTHFPVEMQCVSWDQDLDCSPPQRPTAPPQVAADGRPQLMIQPSTSQPFLDEANDPDMIPETPAEREEVWRKAPVTKKWKTRNTMKEENVSLAVPNAEIQAPMLEVSGPEGPMVVFRP